MKHVNTSFLLLSLVLAFTSFVVCADQQTGTPSIPITQTNQALDELFSEAKVNGTFVLYDVSANRVIIHDQARAEKRFIPASTFKVPNSLIGLATGAVADVDEIIPYGGKPQFLKIWEQDMGLRDAIKISNVPVYQELARRIGLERMRGNLELLDYGNKNIGSVVDRFWLDGPLKISAIEQTEFLARLAQGKLPLPADVQNSVQEITLLDEGDSWILHAKTGWSASSTPHIGWWVGWVVKNGGVFSFALNIDMPNKGDEKKRIVLGKASLRILGIISNDEQ